MEQFNGQNRPAQMPVTIEDRDALKGQYIRHNDSLEILKIVKVVGDGVIAYLVEGFGAEVNPNTDEFLVTWASLKYKHRVMVHVSDVDVKHPEM
ncbi:MAG: hypothetical protein ACR2PR_08145 [Pseudohongiellaceae bacterium]